MVEFEVILELDIPIFLAASFILALSMAQGLRLLDDCTGIN